MSRLRLTINSDLKDVVLVGLAVGSICEHLKMDSLHACQIQLCAVEAVTNAIRHAYGGESGHEVSVTLVIHEDKLELDVADMGRPMPQERQAQLVNGSSVLQFNPADHAALPEGGMGLQIMHDVMDTVSYQRQGGVNTLQLIHLFDAVNESAYNLRQPVKVEHASGLRKV